ncbi:MAG: EamA family transporter RarD [Clostridiales bacterium]|jgi:chloramphenicol-sensitive protein RarD|nr:EamA family transporter RarD [Clostridiales bacterium]
MDKKSVLQVALGHVMWGILPLYWAMLAHMDPMFNLACRICWAVAVTVGVLAATKKLPPYKAVFVDKQKMKYLIPAAVFLLLDWGVFIYAVQSGHVLDTSLGYYMGPFVVFAIDMLVFKEKHGKHTLIAMLLVLIGVAFFVVYNVIQYGRFPMLSILLSCLFAIYAMLKKFAQVDSVVGIAAETTMMLPLALVFLIVFRGADVAALTFGDHLLLIGAGVVTAVPMMLYSVGVIRLPFAMLGFMQYISPTLSLLCGLLLGETVTPDKLVALLFIWAGIGLYMYAAIKEENRAGGGGRIRNNSEQA